LTPNVSESTTPNGSAQVRETVLLAAFAGRGEAVDPHPRVGAGAHRERCLDEWRSVADLAGERSHPGGDALGRLQACVEGVALEDLLRAVPEHLVVGSSPTQLSTQPVGVLRCFGHGYRHGTPGQASESFARRPNRSVCGADKLATAIRKAGYDVGRDHVARLMGIDRIEGIGGASTPR
jgi:hypothetical protein